MRQLLFGAMAFCAVFAWLPIVLYQQGCEQSHGGDEPGITRACIRSFAPTLETWEGVFGRVPAECRSLDVELEVQLVAASDMPCFEPLGANELRTECVSGDVLYLNEALDDVALVDASVHGWLHALNRCVNGDLDADHIRYPLWGVYGPDTVETQAQASADFGECL